MAKDSRLENQECLEINCPGRLVNTDIRDPTTRQLIYQCGYCGRQYTYDEWFTEFEEKTRPSQPRARGSFKNLVEVEKELAKNKVEQKPTPPEPESQPPRKTEYVPKKKSDFVDFGYLNVHSYLSGIEAVAIIREAQPLPLLVSANLELVRRETPFTVMLPVGKYTLTAEYNSAYGLLVQTKTAVVKSGETTDLDFNFFTPEPPKGSLVTEPHPSGREGTGNIHGHITDEEGNPLEGAWVYLVGGDLSGYNSSTDETGYYRIDVGDLKGEFRVAARISGFKTKIKKVQRARKDKYQICDFKLNPSEEREKEEEKKDEKEKVEEKKEVGSIYGQVKNEKGEKLANIEVTILPTTMSATTDSNGNYEILNVLKRTGTIEVKAKDQAKPPKYKPETQEVTIARPEDTKKVNFVLKGYTGVPVPERRQISVGGVSVHLKGAIGSLTSIIIGLIVSAVLRNPYFFFGFFFIGANILMPNMEDLDAVRQNLRRIKQFYNAQINRIQADRNMPDDEKIKEIDQLVRTEKNALDAERLAKEVYGGVFNRVNMVIILKHLFKALGTLSFVLAFVNTGLPFSNILALVAAFVGYFAIGGYKIPFSQTGGAPPAAAAPSG